MNGRMKVYGDSRSGNCLKVRWTADYLHLEYDWADVDVLSGATRRDDFLAINPSGQIPVAVLPDGSVLSQSNAIIHHLAVSAGGELLPKDRYRHSKVLEWMFWEQYSHEPYIAVRRFQKLFLGKNDGDIDENLLMKGQSALQRMEKALQSSDYFVGGEFTLADIALLPYTRAAEEGGFDLTQFPAVTAWIKRCETALGIGPL